MSPQRPLEGTTDAFVATIIREVADEVEFLGAAAASQVWPVRFRSAVQRLQDKAAAELRAAQEERAQRLRALNPCAHGTPGHLRCWQCQPD